MIRYKTIRSAARLIARIVKWKIRAVRVEWRYSMDSGDEDAGCAERHYNQRQSWLRYEFRALDRRRRRLDTIKSALLPAGFVAPAIPSPMTLGVPKPASRAQSKPSRV